MLTREITRRLAPLFEALFTAYAYAKDTNSDVWDFAVPIRLMRKLGTTDSDLRWLVKKGLVAHSKEVTVLGDNGREFRSTGNLTFTRRTCFVLTDQGVKVAQAQRKATVPVTGGMSDHTNGEPQIPFWDSCTRNLRVNGYLVKRFRWPAVNQEVVLCAFQEEGWPERIDDPLPPQPEQDSKRRLADTIKCLNRKQNNQLIHFRGDGTGEGIVWELVKSDS